MLEITFVDIHFIAKDLLLVTNFIISNLFYNGIPAKKQNKQNKKQNKQKMSDNDSTIRAITP
ncbi:hypothetical protein B5E88_11950 [Enterococcus cecorum]|uniref:Uncharacterized protein n=1 Tax=Enterococcus cecorum TaxID=44008 RepID=A0A1Y4QTH3_9ENTE|nr:hypothetical protein B5E88_11950 [Enterococcus cecorum]